MAGSWRGIPPAAVLILLASLLCERGRAGIHADRSLCVSGPACTLHARWSLNPVALQA
jgi:hypothetical protein